jgi:hypothetical protein
MAGMLLPFQAAGIVAPVDDCCMTAISTDTYSPAGNAPWVEDGRRADEEFMDGDPLILLDS